MFDLSDYQRRLPIYLLVDCSGSMRGTRIEEAKRGILSLVSELKNNPQALETVYISVITFSNTVEQVSPLTELVKFKEPELVPNGGTMLGKALGLLSDCLKTEVKHSDNGQKGDWKPFAFILTDGSPSDISDYQKYAEKLKASNDVNIIACAVGYDAKADMLMLLTNNVIKTDSLSNGDITNYFSWVSSSVMQSTNNIRRNQRNDFNLSSLPNGFEIVTNQDSSHSNTNNSHKVNPNVIIKNDVEKSYEELASLASSVVMIGIHDETGELIGSGSGIAIGNKGYILTNCHVVGAGVAFSVKIENYEGIFPTVEVIKYHPKFDLAVIRIDHDLTPLPIYDGKKKLVRGQKCVAIGSPLGLFNSVSDGIISGFRKDDDLTLIQFTAPISHGSSGGALLNTYGEVIGITTSGTDRGENINFAVSYEQIRQFASNFIS